MSTKNNPSPGAPPEEGQQQPPAKTPESKQGVINEDDTKTGTPLSTVRIKGLRGECGGAKFSNECVAQNVTAEQLDTLRGQFKQSVEII
jgi:hypothetical protein